VLRAWPIAAAKMDGQTDGRQPTNSPPRQSRSVSAVPSYKLGKNDGFFPVAPAAMTFPYLGKSTGIVISTAPVPMQLELGGKMCKIWSVDSLQNH